VTTLGLVKIRRERVAAVAALAVAALIVACCALVLLLAHPPDPPQRVHCTLVLGTSGGLVTGTGTCADDPP
jgi:hypothetical protein